MTQQPVLSKSADDPEGVPISAIIFGGRRATTVPLVLQSFNWAHGVFWARRWARRPPPPRPGKVGVVRRDPMAMLPFCGYNMGDYFAALAGDAARASRMPPKIFMVNWFRKGKDGKFLWPGFGENMRVLKWIVDRARGLIGAQETVFGWVPRPGDLDLSGLEIAPERFREATDIDLDEWETELESQREFFDKIGPTMPKALKLTRELLMANIEALKS